MTDNFLIQKATSEDAANIAIMVGELLQEIMSAIGIQAFDFELEETITQLNEFIEQEKYFVFVAQKKNGELVGFISLYESYALYAGGTFGTIPELYIRPQFRSRNIGHCLLEQVKAFGRSRGWRRLEVTTPPLPQFDKTLAFYEKEEFAITGGRKLKVCL